MRQRWVWWAAGSGVVVTIAVACGPTESSCEETATCGIGVGGASGSAGSTGGGNGVGGIGGALSGGANVGGSSEAGSSGSGGTPNDPDAGVCKGTESPAVSGCVIDSKWGVFVSPTGNDTTGRGRQGPAVQDDRQGAPGCANAASKRLYVCDNGTGYAEQVTVDAAVDGVTAYGGFDCTWTYAAANHAKVHPATGIPLTVKGITTGVTLENFEFDAADATAAGTSSIGAMVVSSMKVVLSGVKVVAGKGALRGAGSRRVER